jgi:hypothetical protein
MIQIDATHPMYLHTPAQTRRGILSQLGRERPGAGDATGREAWLRERTEPQRNYPRGHLRSALCACGRRKRKLDLYCGGCTRQLAPQEFKGKRGPDKQPRKKRGSERRWERV